MKKLIPIVVALAILLSGCGLFRQDSALRPGNKFYRFDAASSVEAHRETP